MYDKIFYILLGCLIGFIVGYFARTLQEIKEEIHEVDEHVKNHNEHERDERGAWDVVTFPNIALLIVVVLTAVAAFSSQAASNRVEDSQRYIEGSTYCNRLVLTDVLDAVNARTEYSSEQAQANIDLQRSQSEFLTVLLEVPPPEEARQTGALQRYFVDLNDFLRVQNRTAQNIKDNPYPTTDQFDRCVAEETDERQR